MGKYIIRDNKVVKLDDELSEAQQRQFDLLLAHTDSMQAIRIALNDENNTISIYNQMELNLSRAAIEFDNDAYKQAADIIKHIRDDEITHTGLLQKALSLLNTDNSDKFNEGVKQGKKIIKQSTEVQE